tara:strand:- start:7 stop:630 length:624 start_codon:yes stop_codon:yes gene_type:complete
MSEMKLIMENWRQALSEQDPPSPQTVGQKAAGGLKKVSALIAKGFGKMDDYMQQDYCEKKFPLHLKGQGDIDTWGDLLALLKCGIEYKDKTKFLKTVASFVPGISAGLTALEQSNNISQFVLAMYQMDDDQRPQGNLGKLDMDDDVSDIIDNKVERAYIEFLIKKIDSGQLGGLEEPINPQWDITTDLQQFLHSEKNNRTITGFEGQ